VIFQFFKMSTLPSWILKLTKFYSLTVPREPMNRITVPNFVKITRSIEEIYCNFSNFKMAVTVMLNFQNHEILLSDGAERESPVASFCKILSKSVHPLQRYCKFFEFSR